jgi:lysozyme
MNTDATGRTFITREEGEILHTYHCPAGILTIGVGHTGPDVYPASTLTHEASQALLSRDLARFEVAVHHLVRVPLTQNQFNALVSFAFNLGEGALQKSSLLRLVNAGNRDRATITAAFKLWRNVNGKPSADIEARRAREAALFFTT